MKVTALIRKTAKKNDVESSATIYFRLRDGKKDIKVASELEINPNHWNAEKFGYKDRVATVSEHKKQELNTHIQNIFNLINDQYTPNCDKEWLATLIGKYHHPNRYVEETPNVEDKVEESKPQTLLEFYDYFMEHHEISEVRRKNFRVIGRVLKRFELYQRIQTHNPQYTLYIDDITPQLLEKMRSYFRDEHILCTKYPKLFEEVQEKRAPKPRGHNALVDYFSRIRTFFLWCYSKKITINRPFDEFVVGDCVYGTPILISKEERNKIFETDLSDDPKLALQRDIFVFQALVGCRPGDLFGFTSLNIVNGGLEYIADKTSKKNPRTIRVPLNPKALEIIKRHGQQYPLPLFPFVNSQDYNEMIKQVIIRSGIDRPVIRLNPTTSEKEHIMLSQIATAYTARKTFIGNLYKENQDPDVIGSMSGHVEGSKAFRRYRTIDEEIKEKLIQSID